MKLCPPQQGVKRSRSWKNVSVGDWDPDLQHIKLSRLRGKLISTLTHFDGPQGYIFAEEAVFLVDRGELEVRWNGMPVSLQELTDFMKLDGISLEHYAAVSQLREMGYVVRHLRKNLVSSDEYNSVEFDVFSPGKHKGNQAAPCFRLLLLHNSLGFPHLQYLQKMQTAAGELPLRVGVVSSGDVIWYDMKMSEFCT